MRVISRLHRHQLIKKERRKGGRREGWKKRKRNGPRGPRNILPIGAMIGGAAQRMQREIIGIKEEEEEEEEIGMSMTMSMSTMNMQKSMRMMITMGITNIPQIIAMALE